MQFNRVPSPDDADPNGMIVTLFLCKARLVRGWYVGPVSLFRQGGINVPYAARSSELLGIVAVLRAHDIAEKHGLPVSIVDPDDLWDKMVDV